MPLFFVLKQQNLKNLSRYGTKTALLLLSLQPPENPQHLPSIPQVSAKEEG